MNFALVGGRQVADIPHPAGVLWTQMGSREEVQRLAATEWLGCKSGVKGTSFENYFETIQHLRFFM